MNISHHKNIILIIIAALLIFFGYWFFFISKKDPAKNLNSSIGLTVQNPSSSNTQYDKDFVASLVGLNSVSLDTALFQSKAYQMLSYPEIPFLVNYSMETGRDNPFLPINFDNSSSQTSQTQVIIDNNPSVNSAPKNISTSTPAVKNNPSTPAPTPKKF